MWTQSPWQIPQKNTTIYSLLYKRKKKNQRHKQMSKTRIMRQTKTLHTEEITFFYKLQKKKEKKNSEQKNHLNTLNGNIRQTKRDRCHLFYINVNDWCMTLKCSTFLWKFWLLLVGLNERKKGLISCSVIIVCMFDLWFIQMLFVQLSIALFGIFFSPAFKLYHLFQMEWNEYCMYTYFIHVCKRKCMKIRTERKKSNQKPPERVFFCNAM